MHKHLVGEMSLYILFWMLKRHFRPAHNFPIRNQSPRVDPAQREEANHLVCLRDAAKREKEGVLPILLSSNDIIYITENNERNDKIIALAENSKKPI